MKNNATRNQLLLRRPKRLGEGLRPCLKKGEVQIEAEEEAERRRLVRLIDGGLSWGRPLTDEEKWEAFAHRRSSCCTAPVCRSASCSASVLGAVLDKSSPTQDNRCGSKFETFTQRMPALLP